MSLRVNLMRDDEFRYQGPVSRKFLGRTIGGSIAAIVALWLAFVFQNQVAVKRELKQLEADWAQVETRFKSIKQKRTDQANWLAVQQELRQWASNRVVWADRLDELQHVTPATMQLTRLSIRGEWEFIRPPVPPPPEDGSAPKPLPPPTPARRYAMALSGRAAGERVVLDMVSDLKQVPGYVDLFETIKLQRVLRDENPNDAADRSFDIEGLALPRKLQ